jgi:glycosyltransferase involved in cell wall biosynthesis
MKVAFAIPTFNRREKLQAAISAIRGLEVPDGVEVVIVLSNVASQDSTSAYLEHLRGMPGYIIRNLDSSDFKYLHPYSLGPLIPSDIDWVWWHGDDDVLINPMALVELKNFINANQVNNLSLIHTPQAIRADSSGVEVVGTLTSMCNRFGYVDFLGWMSSLIFRRDRFCEIFGKLMSEYGHLGASVDELWMNRVSSIVHSRIIYEVCHLDRVAFIDRAWIDAQSQSYSSQAKALWREEKTDDRWFFVVDDWHNLAEKSLLPKDLKLTFFKWLASHFWDRLSQTLVRNVLTDQKGSELVKLESDVLASVESLFTNPGDRRLYRGWYQMVSMKINSFIRRVEELRMSAQDLGEVTSASGTPVYSIKYLPEHLKQN